MRRLKLPIAITPRGRGLLAVLIFIISWFTGAASIVGGFETGAYFAFAATFVVAVLFWWASYGLSRSASGRGMTVGLIALALWMLALTFSLLADFRGSIASPFFWTVAVILLVVVVVLSISEARTSAANTVPNS